MTETATRSERPKIKRLRDFPEFAQAEDKLSRLQGELVELRRQYSELLAIEPADVAGSRRERINQLAAAELSGQKPKGGTPGVPISTYEIEDRQLKLKFDKEVKAEAIRLQEQEVLRLRQKYSREICKELQTWHKSEVRALAEVLIAAARQNVRLDEVYQTLARDDVQFSAHLPNSRFLGGALNPKDYASALCHFLREAVEAGILDRRDPLLKQVPAAFDPAQLDMVEW